MMIIIFEHPLQREKLDFVSYPYASPFLHLHKCHYNGHRSVQFSVNFRAAKKYPQVNRIL